MKTDLLKKISFPISTITLISILIFPSIIVVLNINIQEMYAKKDSNDPCPQTMSMGATYVDKKGCIRPCPTSESQGQVPAECPQTPQSQQPDQSIQQQQ